MKDLDHPLLKQAFDSALDESLVAFRRDLHQHPELSWQEYRTADKVCQFLDGLGVPYTRDVAKTGIIAEIGAPSDTPFVALRADMDALPVQEETGLTFASKTDGVMHACGHDGHTSMLLGAASLLTDEPSLPAPVRLIFQPAEETGSGAQAMIEAGATEKVSMIFGGHLDRHYPSGAIAVTEGPVNASTDQFHVRITGKGGHAARPHETLDPVVVGSLLVMAIQTIVSREVNPAHPSVVTVGRFHAGTAGNVIAGTARLDGTIRAQDSEVREYLKEAITRTASAIGQLHGARVDIELVEGTPALINTPGMSTIAREAASATVKSPDQVVRMEQANMGGEDFSYYLESVPGCYVRFGSQVPGRAQYPNHSSKFDFDEKALVVGAAYYHALAIIAGREICKMQSKKA